jgi:hypothetical protein
MSGVPRSAFFFVPVSAPGLYRRCPAVAPSGAVELL